MFAETGKPRPWPFHAYAVGLSEGIWRTVVADEYPTGTCPAREDCGSLFEQWKYAAELEDKASFDTKLHESDPLGITLCELRAACLGEKGRVGLIPSIVRERGFVRLFQDEQVPFILR